VLTALVVHEASAPILKRIPEIPLALLGREETSLGLVQMQLQTARELEETGVIIPPSESEFQRICRLETPEKAIAYAGALLHSLHAELIKIAPADASDALV
jgi:hypothetical protein